MPRKSKSGGQLIPGGQDASNCPIWGTGDKYLRHRGPGESATTFPVSTQLARSWHEDFLRGNACFQREIPIGSQSSIFQPIPGSYGLPCFNPPAGLISVNPLLNVVFGESYTPACLRMTHTPFLRTAPDYAYGGGWGVNPALALQQNHLWLHRQSAFQISYPSNQYFNVPAGSCGAFRPS